LAKWDEEPDQLDWEAHGYPCAIRRGPGGHLCGYVGIPKEHPLYGVAYSQESPILKRLFEDMMNKPAPDRLAVHLAVMMGEIESSPEIVFDVHGGITWSENHEPSKSIEGDYWWYGFDCAHAGDLCPNYHYRTPRAYRGSDDVYRDINYVKRETEKLAQQLAEVAKAQEA